jgi:hypothetical protein
VGRTKGDSGSKKGEEKEVPDSLCRLQHIRNSQPQPRVEVVTNRKEAEKKSGIGVTG